MACKIQKRLVEIEPSRFYTPTLVEANAFVSNIPTKTFYSVPDLPLCLGVLKHRAPLVLWVIYNSFEFVADAVYISDLI
jgi:hypothetical protein